jgi:hypothetical protein
MKKPLFIFDSRIAVVAALSISFAMPSAFAAEADSASFETVEYEDIFDEQPHFIARPAAVAGARFGPFTVVDAQTVELVGTIDSSTPTAFRRLIAAHPGVSTLRLVECPGSEDDDANLQLSRLIRARGMNTHVPSGGSVRSGGVELFLAGVKRTADADAEFGVHSWADEDGMEAEDYAANDPVHSNYINYYVDMGMKPETARAFYAFTNKAAPFDGVYYMKPRELQAFGIVN